ncbi:unnamed protein product [Rotaria sp. Silwood1]|nr:unnamed protein product [Rotaria sp. Silwood1]CAF1653335.1 unnamed protein product [Rotaria sp. Silwood1]
MSNEDNVSAVESLIVNDTNNLIELNKKLHRDIISFGYLKETIEIFAYIYMISFKLDDFEKQLTNIQTSIVELEAWYSHINNHRNQ